MACVECGELEDRLSAIERSLSAVESRLLKDFSTLKQSELVDLHESLRQAKGFV